MEEIFKQIMENPYSGFSAWIIGAIASLIGIYTFFFKEDKIIIKEEEKYNIRYDARGICADCSNVISANSLICNKCGSSKPFQKNILIKKAIQDLNYNFSIFNRYVEHSHESVLENIKYYVYSFIPATILLLILTYIGEKWDNDILNFFIGIGGLFLILHLYVMPHVIIQEYTFNFNFSRCSDEELNKLDNKINYTINSLNDKDSLIELSDKIKEFLMSIKLFSNIQFYKNIFFWLYIVFLFFGVIYMSLKLVSMSFDSLIHYISLEKIFMLIVSFGLFYTSTLALLQFYWINFIYFTNVSISGKRHLKDYQYIITKRIEIL